MALIACSDCGAQISEQAAACIKCGRPMAAPPTAAPTVQTIEQPGKQWKLLQALGSIALVLGMGSCMAAKDVSESPATAWLLFLGLLGYGLGRFGTWWNHG